MSSRRSYRCVKAFNPADHPLLEGFIPLSVGHRFMESGYDSKCVCFVEYKLIDSFHPYQK
jgi:hypothetical protein